MKKGFESSELSCFPISSDDVSAGFPSPAENHSGGSLDLTAYLIKHPEATFFLRVRGDSMTGAGIFDGDILIVDRSLSPVSGDIVISVLDGEFTVKRLIMRNNGTVELRPENPRFKPLRIYEESQLDIWGVVTGAVKSFR
ncbi:MAG: translesion error-prone DNA polymerase V autoproteolytic subunit [Planctomycetaceae bacterium]|jgi:DNA polymerase V|nr:translesion error-prone DNA polymerase V autoproteolytic subunit [Planctomycetaceae bacterium]